MAGCETGALNGLGCGLGGTGTGRFGTIRRAASGCPPGAADTGRTDGSCGTNAGFSAGSGDSTTGSPATASFSDSPRTFALRSESL